MGAFTRYLEMIEKGLRPRRRAPIHHTAKLSGFTGQPHTHSRETQRRIRQQERAAWKQLEREQKSE